jgi:SAM-dependent methyltransferase
MHDPSEDRLYGDPELAQFYDLESGWGPDLEYCLGLAQGARSVLDLGCGTGLLLARLADGRSAVGVDPAAAMLEIARHRPGGERVKWVEGDARTVRLGRRFDLVVLTGHAFQVFLSDADQRAALATNRAHLSPGGRFVFDARNPAAEEWRAWAPEPSMRAFEHPTLGTVEAWNDVAHDPATGIVTYQTHYHVAACGRHLCAASKIRFTPRDRLAALLDEAGLAVDAWLGDWTGGAYAADSPEIIPVGRLR